MIPLHFIALENSTIALTNNGNNAPDIEYSYDNNTWTQWNYSALSLNAGEKLYFRGDNPTGFSKTDKQYSKFEITGSVNGAGNMISLVDKTMQIINITNFKLCFYRIFYQCDTLNNISIYTFFISRYSFFDSNLLISFSAPNLTYIDIYAFRNCDMLTSFEAPNLTYVGSDAFNNCTSLSSFEAPNLTYVGSDAFNYSALTSFDASNLIYVASDAFFLLHY